MVRGWQLGVDCRRCRVQVISRPALSATTRRSRRVLSSHTPIRLSGRPETRATRVRIREHITLVCHSAGHHEPSYEEVSACIRIGHKYEIEDLVQRNLAYLRKLYPSDFDAYLVARRSRPPTFTPAHAIGVVNLARLTGTDALLPAALMECCTLSGTGIVTGLERADGSREMLSTEDLGRCFVGRTRMAQASARIAHQMFRQSIAKGCRHPACCVRVLQRLLNELGDGRIELLSSLDWFAPWTGYVDDKDEDRELCTQCYKMLSEERPRQLQREVWTVLPAMMGVSVEGWGEKTSVEA
ncbi:hypothetical protein GY45DRAFT_1318691 [Cubamyces sp. BRFM 1775]|nr:hypothetical protein GY45DRAFT_1318691 [Cubamyces sp. BRFM 1775]